MKIDDYMVRVMMRNSKMHDIDHVVHMHRYLNLILKSLGSKFNFILWQSTQFEARLSIDRTQLDLSLCKRYYEKSYNQP